MAKVDGNTHETAFQNGGIELTGQMVPLRKRQRENARKKSASRRKLRSRQSVRQKKRSVKRQKLRKHRKPPQKSNRQNLSPKLVR